MIEVAEPVAIVSGQRRRRQRQISLVEDIARPIMKWPGGKTRLLDRLIGLLPSDLATLPGCRYFEPFVGGGALFFRLRPAMAVISDSNEDLMELYSEVARDPASLHAAASDIFDRHDLCPESTYYGIREAWNELREKWSPTRRAATLLYLNRAGFNGLFRLNRSGKNNVPIGKASSATAPWPSRPSLPRIIAAGSVLRHAELGCGDFTVVSDQAQRGDFVYFDPPYLPPGSAAAFSAYTGAGFSRPDHERLVLHALDLALRGVRVMISSVDSLIARELLSGFRISSVTAPRSINSSGTGRGKIGELIATAGYDPVTA